MALNLSADAILEKNKLASDGVWLVLLQITADELDEPIRVVRNTEDVEWNGYTWQAFPFELDEIVEGSSGEISKFIIRVSNVRKQVQYYLEEAQGGVGAAVKLMVIHSKHLENVVPEIEFDFVVASSSADNKWVSFTLGASVPYNKTFGNRGLKYFCRHAFKGTRCAYSGSETACDKTLTRCRELENSVNFGGLPGVGLNGAFYA